MHETHEGGEGEADELQLMVHNRHIKLHTQKEPRRDSDFVVLTVCYYRQKTKKQKKQDRKKKSLVFFIFQQSQRCRFLHFYFSLCSLEWFEVSGFNAVVSGNSNLFSSAVWFS